MTYKTFKNDPKIFDYREFYPGHRIVFGTHMKIDFKNLSTLLYKNVIAQSEFPINMGDMIATKVTSGRIGLYEVIVSEPLTDFTFKMYLTYCGYIGEDLSKESMEILDGYGIPRDAEPENIPKTNAAPVPNVEKLKTKPLDRVINWTMVLLFFITFPTFIIDWFTAPFAQTYKDFWEYISYCYTRPVYPKR